MTARCNTCVQLTRELRAMTFERNMAQAAVTLLNSMVLSGEQHSEVSREAVHAALQDRAPVESTSDDR